MPLDVYQKLFSTARCYPEAIAVMVGTEYITYADFLRRVGGFAATFKRNNAIRIAIHLPAGIDAYAAMFGALSAGAEYAPLNINAPDARLGQIVQAYQPDLLVSLDTSLSERLQLPDLPVMSAESVSCCNPAEPEAIGDTQVAYTIFTSGSTGVPKGVVISRIGLNRYAEWIAQAIPVNVGERWSQHPNIAFDLSVMDIYGALPQGATLVVPNTDFDRLFPAIFIKKQSINIWNSVPSVVGLMRRSGQLDIQHLSSLRLLTFCGEALPVDLLRYIIDQLPEAVVQNTYGPTEATVSCTSIRFDRNHLSGLDGGSVAIGQAISGIDLMLDGEEYGELLIVGDQVALGYLNLPEETASRFFEVADADGKAKRGFRSGDLVERIKGELYFVARIDDSYKIKGHFVNLLGVEAVLTELANQLVVCTVLNDQVHAFVADVRSIDLDSLRTQASKRLMPYELPVELHQVDQLPRNMNDKIDRKALNENLHA